MKRLTFIMLITYFLCGCGGGGPGGGPAPAVFRTAHANPDDAILAVGDAYDLRIALNEDTNPVTSAAYQNTQTGTIIAWPGRTRDLGFGGFTAFLAEVAKYPRMEYIYVYDELGWKSGVFDLSDQTAALAASTQARAQGLKTVVCYAPITILDPRFTLGIANGFDVIVIDLYPNIPPPFTVPTVTGNPYTDWMIAMIAKLRGMGFTGEIWYAYQAFGVVGNDPVWFNAQLVLQRETILAAESLGISGISPFGMYLGTYQLGFEPHLIPLEDTEPLVIPPGL